MRKIYLLFALILVVLLNACKKDDTIGADILPNDDLLNVGFTDTFTVYSKTLSDTFMRTDKLAKNYLGVINDAKFGFQQASIVTELDRPSTVYDDTLGPFLVDSVVLLLKYNNIYGDSTVPQNFRISTISNKITEFNTYYSNSTAFPASTQIGSVNNYLFRPMRNETVSRTDSVGIPSIFKVPLDNSIGTTILNLGQNVLRDSSLFKNNFPGIIIENAGTSGNAMAEIDLNSFYSGMVIYYRDKKNTLREMKLPTALTKIQNASITTRQNGINLFTKNLSSTVDNVVASGLQTDSVNYVLGQAGTIIKVQLPTLTNMGKAAVNKAELVVTQIEQNTGNFATPIFMLLLKRNASGELDALATGDGVGVLDTALTDNMGKKIARYTFGITKYIQAISLNRESNADLYIATYRAAGTDESVNFLNSTINGTIVNFGFTPSRVVVAGANYSDERYRMKLNLIYSPVK